MNPVSTIARKRDGYPLAPDEMAEFINGYVDGKIPDYQMSALAMAIYLRGMDTSETAALTDCMLRSGTRLNWDEGGLPKVDKHSTGGIGDKTSLILAPLLACADLHVPMISGRGLGPTGGTLDKLEAIPGFRTNLSIDEIQQITQQVGCVITGTTPEIAPADRKLYSLRDVTGTVASIPLITASIMSKKLAENLDALVLDVKFGSGAFMKTLEQGRALATSLVETGKRMGVSTIALLTDMNQPLGQMIGNAVEVDESIATLKGSGPADLRELTLTLGAELMCLSAPTTPPEVARQQLADHLDSGRAYEKFREMVAAQGGDVDAPRPLAPTHELPAPRSGFLTSVDAELLGQIIIELGGGRRQKTDTIDHSVGLQMLVRIGDSVNLDQPLLRVFASRTQLERVAPLLTQPLTIGDEVVPLPPLIAGRVV